MNEELFPDDEVTRLKRCIAHFKRYDKERKEYYAKALIELGQLKEYVEDLEESIDEESDYRIKRLKRRIKNQRKLINDLTLQNSNLKKKLSRLEEQYEYKSNK